MNSQPNVVERRERPRFGVMAEVEDITYSILRKHGVGRGPGGDAVAAKPIPEKVKQEGNTTMANLKVIISNDQPTREEKYPLTWLLYKDKDTLEIHVRHDSHNRPFVLDKGAA
jgi:hypothetical protein